MQLNPWLIINFPQSSDMSEGHILEKQKTGAGLYADVFSILCILFFFIILWCSVCILTPEQ